MNISLELNVLKNDRYEGVKGFYKGILPTLLRVTPATAITFVVYENVSHYLTAQHDEQAEPASSLAPSSSSSNLLVDGSAPSGTSGRAPLTPTVIS